MRLNVKMMMLSMAVSAMLVGCGGSNGSTNNNNNNNGAGNGTDSNNTSTVEIAGPGAAFVGATAFTKEMVAGQTIYNSFDDNEDGSIAKDEWERITFTTDGNIMADGEIDGSYSVTNKGELIVDSQGEHLTLTLNTPTTTEWNFTIKDTEGRNESKTFFLELKYNTNLLVGKKFSVPFDSPVSVEYLADGTAKGYDATGNLVNTIEYTITDGVLIHRPAEDADKRYLIKVEADGSLLAWHQVEDETDLFTVIK